MGIEPYPRVPSSILWNNDPLTISLYGEVFGDWMSSSRVLNSNGTYLIVLV